MVGLTKYAVLSTLASVGVVYHAVHYAKQFFPAMKFLATSKISMVILGNMAFVITLLFGQLLKVVFLGNLREAEVERLYELSRHEIMETCLAMTIFRDEFNTSFVALFTILLFVKIFHWLSQKRVEYIETTPSVSRLAHFRIISFMVLLLVTDCLLLYQAVSYTSKKGPSVLLLFAFEYVILASSVVATFLKYGLYTVDVVMDGQWENKAVYVFYLELVRDLFHLLVYLVFFGVISRYYPLPLHLVRDLYETFRNFKARVADFIRYRRITSNMNDRFVDATPEELGRGDATCIVCREEMTSAKKLPCGHLFHVHCLRSWLERQQTCPTCRSPVLTPDPLPTPPPAGGDGQAPVEQQPIQRGQGAPQEVRAQQGGNPYAAPGAAAGLGFPPAHIHPQMAHTWRPAVANWYPAYMPYYGQGGHAGAVPPAGAAAFDPNQTPYGLTEAQLMFARTQQLYAQAQASAFAAHQMAMSLLVPNLAAVQNLTGGQYPGYNNMFPLGNGNGMPPEGRSNPPPLQNPLAALTELQRRQMELLLPFNQMQQHAAAIRAQWPQHEGANVDGASGSAQQARAPQPQQVQPPVVNAAPSDFSLPLADDSAAAEPAEFVDAVSSATVTDPVVGGGTSGSEGQAVGAAVHSGSGPEEEGNLPSGEDEREGLRQRRLARFGTTASGDGADTA